MFSCLFFLVSGTSETKLFVFIEIAKDEVTTATVSKRALTSCSSIANDLFKHMLPVTDYFRTESGGAEGGADQGWTPLLSNEIKKILEASNLLIKRDRLLVMEEVGRGESYTQHYFAVPSKNQVSHNDPVK